MVARLGEESHKKYSSTNSYIAPQDILDNTTQTFYYNLHSTVFQKRMLIDVYNKFLTGVCVFLVIFTSRGKSEKGTKMVDERMTTRWSIIEARQDTGVITQDIPRSTDSKQSKALAKLTKVDISLNLETGPTHIMIKDYNLNRDTAIAKRIEAAHRKPLDYKVKGGGHLATLRAMSY